MIRRCPSVRSGHPSGIRQLPRDAGKLLDIGVGTRYGPQDRNQIRDFVRPARALRAPETTPVSTYRSGTPSACRRLAFLDVFPAQSSPGPAVRHPTTHNWCGPNGWLSEILWPCVTDLPHMGDVGPIITRVGSPLLP